MTGGSAAYGSSAAPAAASAGGEAQGAIPWGIAVVLSLLLAGAVFGARWSTNTFVEQRLTGRTGTGAIAVGDQTQYLALARYFRGEPRPAELAAPFAYRVLPSFLAAKLPGEPRVTFILLNFVAIAIAAVFLFALVSRLGLGLPAAIAGTALYTVSFPVFYYGTDALTDPMATAFLTVAIWAVYDGHFVWYLAAVSFGALCRETDLAAMLVFAVWGVWSRRTSGLRLALGVLAPLAIVALPRIAFADLTHGSTYVNAASLEQLLSNLSRPRTYLTLMLTLWFVPVALAWRLARRPDRAETLFPTRAGAQYVQIMAVVLALIPAYALVAAYTDGRFFWVLFPAAIPFALACLRVADFAGMATPWGGFAGLATWRSSGGALRGPMMGAGFSRRFDGLVEQPHWCGEGPDRLYTMTYQPPAPPGPVVVIAGPDGEERDWASRALVTSARAVAAGGCTVVRFDYRGQGESGGRYEETTFASRIEDLLAVCAHARAAHGHAPVVVGVRLGAAVALLAAARDAGVAGLVLWEPVADHTAYVNLLLRQNVSAQMVAYGSVQTDRAALIAEARAGAPVSVNGFLLSGAFIDDVMALDAQRVDVARPALVMTAGTPQGLFGALTGATYVQMACHPFWKEPKVYTAAPLPVLTPILTWIRETTAPALREVS